MTLPPEKQELKEIARRRTLWAFTTSAGDALKKGRLTFNIIVFARRASARRGNLGHEIASRCSQ